MDFLVRTGQWTEADDHLFESRLAELNGYYNGSLRSNIHRPAPVTAEQLAEGKKYISSIQQKKIFKVEEYSYQDGQKLYCGYLSSDFAGSENYFIRLYFTTLQGELKIIAEYYLCDDCNGTGEWNNKKCTECGGEGWIWQGGRHLPLHQTPLKVEELLKPAGREN